MPLPRKDSEMREGHKEENAANAGGGVSNAIMMVRHPQVATALQDAYYEFITGVKNGLRDVRENDLASSAEVQEINERLELMEVMPGFDQMEFRTYVLALAELADSKGKRAFTAEEISCYESLDEEARTSIEGVTFNLLHFYFDEASEEEIREEVARHMKMNHCGKALKVLRSNAPFLPERFVKKQRALVWQNIAAADPRFDTIANRHQGSKGCYRAAPSVNQSAGREDGLFFERALSGENPLELASDDENDEVRRMLDFSETMKHFDSMLFREYLLAAWEEIIEGTQAKDSKLMEIKTLLEPNEFAIADEIVTDFSALLSEKQSITLTREVDELLGRNKCGEAFDLIREFSLGLDPLMTLPLLTKTWRQIEIIDSRFKRIADMCEKLWRNRFSIEADKNHEPPKFSTH